MHRFTHIDIFLLSYNFLRIANRVAWRNKRIILSYPKGKTSYCFLKIIIKIKNEKVSCIQKPILYFHSIEKFKCCVRHWFSRYNNALYLEISFPFLKSYIKDKYPPRRNYFNCYRHANSLNQSTNNSYDVTMKNSKNI